MAGVNLETLQWVVGIVGFIAAIVPAVLLRYRTKWRLEIEIEWENKEQTRGKVYIVEVSLHYGD